MNADLRRQIHRDLDQRQTEELREIWRTNDRRGWSEMAFEEIAVILTGRGELLPPQQEPPAAAIQVEEEDEDRLEAWEANALDREDQPVFYDVLDVIELHRAIKPLLIAVVIVNVLAALPSLRVAGSSILAWVGADAFWPNALTSVVWMVLLLLSTGLTIALTYMALRALSYILRILMEMEFNSRRTSG